MNPQTREALGQVAFNKWMVTIAPAWRRRMNQDWRDLTPEERETFMHIAESVIAAYWKQLAREVKEGEANT